MEIRNKGPVLIIDFDLGRSFIPFHNNSNFSIDPKKISSSIEKGISNI